MTLWWIKEWPRSFIVILQSQEVTPFQARWFQFLKMHFEDVVCGICYNPRLYWCHWKVCILELCSPKDYQCSHQLRISLTQFSVGCDDKQVLDRSFHFILLFIPRQRYSLFAYIFLFLKKELPKKSLFLSKCLIPMLLLLCRECSFSKWTDSSL